IGPGGGVVAAAVGRLRSRGAVGALGRGHDAVHARVEVVGEGEVDGDGTDEAVGLLDGVIADDLPQVGAQLGLEAGEALMVGRGELDGVVVGLSVRPRETTAALLSASRRSAPASSTGSTCDRKALAKAPLTTFSSPFSKRSSIPMAPPHQVLPFVDDPFATLLCGP